jgi:acyl-CoA synthetase (AMP-forming)/AMP-acid ligase II
MTAMSYEDAARHVCATNPIFETTRTEIRGVSYTVFKNVPAHVPALLPLSSAAQGGGAAEYLVFGDERWTFDAFCHDVDRLAAALSQLGVRKGMPVGIAMRNCPELLILFMAIASIGGITVFLNAWWTTQELDYALRDSGARLIFADGQRMARLEPLQDAHGLTLIGVRDGEPHAERTYSDLMANAPHPALTGVQIAPEDDLAIMYSSGTTGQPKGVVQTHRGAINAVFTWLMQAAMAPLITPPTSDPLRPSALVVTPLFHVTATHPVFLLSLPAGAKLTLMPKWDAHEAVRLIGAETITRFMGVPTQSADLMQAARDMGETLPSLDYLGAGGAKRPAAQVDALHRAFPHANIATGWGMTETNANGIGMIGPDYLRRPGSAGRLYPPVQELRFLDDSGRDVPPGEIGEITVKSPCNMRCYLNKPDATREVLQNGWLRTGDLGFIDTDGFVTIVDRKKNIIIRGGENIACLDVEGALHQHPDVIEACAFAVPHPRLGEVVGARVQLRAGAACPDFAQFLAGKIAHFKIPEHLWTQFTPLARGTTDKLDRIGIRRACLATLDTASSQTPA